jgi:hypothetical protein
MRKHLGEKESLGRRFELAFSFSQKENPREKKNHGIPAGAINK